MVPRMAAHQRGNASPACCDTLCKPNRGGTSEVTVSLLAVVALLLLGWVLVALVVAFGLAALIRNNRT
jgi:hypothetical protein